MDIRPAHRILSRPLLVLERLQGEIVRKSIHLLVALVPLLSSLSVPITLSLLAFGTLFYALAEASRMKGNPIFVVSDLTLIASREKDVGRFVLGPITLGLGAMLALILYPEPAASLAIYALAFGDGFASLVGKLVRGPTIPGLRGKTFSGSLACFASVFLMSLRVTSRPAESVAIAATATILEGIPTGDFDNVLIPFGVGLLASAILP